MIRIAHSISPEPSDETRANCSDGAIWRTLALDLGEVILRMMRTLEALSLIAYPTARVSSVTVFSNNQARTGGLR